MNLITFLYNRRFGDSYHIYGNEQPSLNLTKIRGYAARFHKQLVLFQTLINNQRNDTSLAATGALAHRQQNLKWPLGGPKMADRV